MSSDNSCVFCGNKCHSCQTPNHHRLNTYTCDYCGEYILHGDFPLSMWFRENSTPDKFFKIACILNERRLKGLSGITPSDKTDTENIVCGCPQISIKDILAEFPKRANDFLNRVLLNLSRLVKPTQPFEIIRLDLAKNRSGIHLFIQDEQGCRAFLGELAEQGYIRFNKTPSGAIQDHVFFLTVRFWEAIENLQTTAVNNKRAFVAMWFDKSMDAYYEEGIKKAVEDAGYVPVRIDLKDFNNKICDEIIAEIRRCKFLISDFTSQRGGVYFEAGFAKGLGREVIFTVRKDDVEKLHFDTRQYNHIVYDSPKSLYEKLYNRICATIV